MMSPDGCTMKKNENIFISLELQRNWETKDLLLSVQFDRNAPNFSENNECINWSPTVDELDFIKEAFELIGVNNIQPKDMKEDQEVDNSQSIGMEKTEYSHRSSEIRIAPLANDLTTEVPEGPRAAHIKKKNDEEKIFIQADEKKIDEILQRKKQQYDTDDDDAEIIEKMMKQKKRK